tara:strand:+ start:309 stop:503 length:195 start_codon:yes stop_codon:yes gene_type:complete
MIDIDLFVFLCSFCFGMFLIYITAPKPNIVIKYPNINEDTEYTDNKNNCFKLNAKEIECSKKNI